MNDAQTNTALQSALCRLLESQDSDTVNQVFTSVFCEPGEFATVTFKRLSTNAAVLAISDEETGEVKHTIQFSVTTSKV